MNTPDVLVSESKHRAALIEGTRKSPDYSAVADESLNEAALRANLIMLNARQAVLEQELATIRAAKDAIYARCRSRECAERDSYFGQT